MHQLVLDGAVAQQRHDNKSVGVHIQKIEPLYRGRARRGESQSGISGELPRKLARIRHQAVELLHFLVQAGVDGLGLLQGELLALHKLVDVETVPLRRGDAPGGGVGLLKITQRRELGELVADGGARRWSWTLPVPRSGCNSQPRRRVFSFFSR